MKRCKASNETLEYLRLNEKNQAFMPNGQKHRFRYSTLARQSFKRDLQLGKHNDNNNDINS